MFLVLHLAGRLPAPGTPKAKRRWADVGIIEPSVRGAEIERITEAIL